MQQNVFTIFRGDNKTMNLKAIQGNCGGDPLDLTSCTEIDVALPNADGTFTHRLLSLNQVSITSPALLGKFAVTITALISAAFNVGELQSFDVTFTIASVISTVRFYNCFSVYEH